MSKGEKGNIINNFKMVANELDVKITIKICHTKHSNNNDKLSSLTVIHQLNSCLLVLSCHKLGEY